METQDSLEHENENILNEEERLSKLKRFYLNIFQRKTQHCKHVNGCVTNSIKGFLNSFFWGFFIRFLINFLSFLFMARKRKK